MNCGAMNAYLYPPQQRSSDLAPIFPFEVFSIILDHVTRPADLAALSSVCRVLHFLTAPRLFQHVWLDTATPQLLNGLAALQNTTYSSLVKRLEVRGDGMRTDRENELLAFAVGGTIGSMKAMETFHWKCGRRIPRSLYEALSLSRSLKGLVVQFGKADNVVMSGFLLPPFKALRSLTVTGIDCGQTEDWSRVLLSCGGIKELRLGWASSHEEQGRLITPGGGLSNVLRTLIERVSLAERYRADIAMSGLSMHQAFDIGKRLSLEVLELQNLYIPEGDTTLESLFDLSTLTRLSVLGCQINSKWPYEPGNTTTATSPATSSSSAGLPTPQSSHSGSHLSFASKHSTSERPKPILPNIKIFRTDLLSQWTIKVLSACGPLEAVYLLDPEQFVEKCEDDTRVGLVHAIAEHRSLQKLRLSARMLLVGKDFVKVARGCPNLREWGLCTEPTQKQILQLTMPFMTLKTCAFLYSPLLECTKQYHTYSAAQMTDEKKKEIEAFLAHEWFQDLKYLGIGSSVFRGDDTVIENPNAEPPTTMSKCMPDGGGYFSRGVTMLSREDWPENSIFTEGENTLVRV